MTARPIPDATRRRPLVVVALVLLALVPAVVATPAAAAARPFAADSPFNVAIPRDPAIDPESAAMVARATRDRRLYANLYAYGVPIYTATSGAPRYRVSCAMEGTWGRCPLSAAPMPIPSGARPNTGLDGVLTVVDPATNSVGEYWQARRTSDGWAASWGAVNSLSGSGWGGSSTGAGASRLAGVVRISEIKRGVIDHALVLQSDNVCADEVRSPALKTDGTSTREDCLPAGARLQLDPALKLSRLKGLTQGERAVARAMQVYGGYVIDRGGAPLGASFELARDATPSSPGAVYTRAGLRWDYYGLPHVPWTRMRVLRTGQG